tara:strand:+ start:152 stop:409 length:258 start_codon:yes stop_codon:yes gene_type:complete
VNYLAPLTLSIFIHFGIVISFSNILSINFDQFDIDSKKPISAYLVFEQPSIKKTKTSFKEQKIESSISKEKKEEISTIGCRLCSS